MDRMLIICAEESDSSVGFYDSATGAEVARVRVGHWPHELCLSPDGEHLYVSNFGVKDYDERIGEPGASISIIDVRRKVEVDRLYTFRTPAEFGRFRGPHGLQLTPDGRQLYVNVETDDALLIYDLADAAKPRHPLAAWTLGAPVAGDALPDASFALPEGTHNLLFSPDGERLWVTSGPGGVSEFDVRTRTRLRSFHAKGAIRGLSYTVDGSQLIASASGEVRLVDPASLTSPWRQEVPGVRQFLYSCQTPDGLYLLCPAVWEGQLIRIDLATNEVRRMIVGSDPIHVKTVPGSSVAYVSHGRSRYLSKVDWERWEEVDRIPTRGGPNGLILAPFSDRPARKRLVFGAALPSSGGSFEEGQDMRLGHQFWQELVNDAGGMLVGNEVYDVEIVYRDTQSHTGLDPKRDPQPWQKPWTERTPTRKNSVEEVTEALIDEDGARYLFGSYPSPPNLHAARMAADRGLPLVTASGAAGMIYEQQLPNIFGIMSSAKGFLNETFVFLSRLSTPPATAVFWSCKDPAALQDAKTTATFIEADLGMRVLTGGDPASADQGVLLYEHLASDFERLVGLTEELAPDVLAITGHLPESMAAVRALSAGRWAPKAVIFSVGPAFPQFSAQLGKLAEHMSGASMWSAAQRTHGHDRFVTPAAFAREFYERFSKEASYLSAGAMACGLVYQEAFRRAGSVDPADVIAALADPSFSMRSFYSNIAFNADGLNEGRPLVTIQLQKNGDQMNQIALWPANLASGGDFTWPFAGWNT
ncbi:ABC transporter substrate-binding protein [Sandaracinobacteroides hominis]|uniref:ABC transporter substrate-binding protein n=1 Tax=Sandaracinobacteroides hominis TaxID=2780086 RepID=UPI0018F63682|nr:ABC transporter substrate-binding protein [Sandaracinobacteroides hominis]